MNCNRNQTKLQINTAGNPHSPRSPPPPNFYPLLPPKSCLWGWSPADFNIPQTPRSKEKKQKWQNWWNSIPFADSVCVDDQNSLCNDEMEEEKLVSSESEEDDLLEYELDSSSDEENVGDLYMRVVKLRPIIRK